MIIGSVIIIYITASIVDWFFSSTAMVEYRNRALIIKQKLTDLEIQSTTGIVNAQFLYLFEIVYSNRFWSLSRLIRSTISILISIAMISFPVVFFLGLEFSVVIPSLFLKGVEGAFAMFMINFFADFFSLQETNWILRKSQRSKSMKLIFWAFVDISLTILIYAAFAFPLALTYVTLDVNEPPPFFAITCLLSTFVTSAMWMGFFITAMSIRALKIGSPLFKVVLEVIGESKRPARTTAGIISIILLVSYFIFSVISWVGSA